MNLQELIFGEPSQAQNEPIYPHRLHDDLYFTDHVREALHFSRSSWVMDRIFGLQHDENILAETSFQHWKVTLCPDSQILFACYDQQGRILFHELHHPRAGFSVDLLLILEDGILQLKH